MRRVLVGHLLALLVVAGCGSQEPTTVRYECLDNGSKPVQGTATRASDGTWSIQRDTDPDMEPPSSQPPPTEVGKDLEGNLRENGCSVIKD